MQDSDLEAIYKDNISTSHYAALRAVWDSGYNYALSINPAQQGVDPSEQASAATAQTDTPTEQTDPSLGT